MRSTMHCEGGLEGFGMKGRNSAMRALAWCMASAIVALAGCAQVDTPTTDANGGLTTQVLAWERETVDAGPIEVVGTSLRLGTTGEPRISYSNFNVQDLEYASYTGSAWNLESVDGAGAMVGTSSSLALDAAGHPHISYYVQMGGLRYASFDGTAWTIETVDSGSFIGQYTSLVLDGSGQPHIAYYDGGNHNLKYARHDGSGWHTETVDNGANVGSFPSIALDATGHPHISYSDSMYGHLKHAEFDGTSWTLTIVDSYIGGGFYTSIAIDSEDHAHISYQKTSSLDLKYAEHDGTSWSTSVVDVTGATGYWTSLALDPSGLPRIAYQNLTDNDLKYAAYDGTAWTVESVDTSGDVGRYASLDLTADGNPHISYFDATNGALKHAWVPGGEDTTPPSITPTVLGTLGDNGWHVSDVHVSWSVVDDESSIASATGCDATSVTVDTPGTTLTCTAASQGGTNSASVTVTRDATPPVVTVTGVSDGATYPVAYVPTVGCDTADATSGVSRYAAPSLSGGPLGPVTASCSGASDYAGHSGSAAVTYTVLDIALTPEQAVTQLHERVETLVDGDLLNPRQANGLLRPLDNVLKSLEKGKTEAACSQVADFIFEVGEKTPDPIPATEAQDLIDGAELIQLLLGCS